MKLLPRWSTLLVLAAAVPVWLHTQHTTYEWHDPPPAGGALVQVGGSLKRSLWVVQGLSLQLQWRDGQRFSWIGTPSHVPAGLVDTEQGVHLVLVQWGWPLAEPGPERGSIVCWVRDGRPGPAVVTPLFMPEPLAARILPGFGYFVDVKPEVVQRAPRMAAAELLRRHDAQPQRGPCPNLYAADNV